MLATKALEKDEHFPLNSGTSQLCGQQTSANLLWSTLIRRTTPRSSCGCRMTDLPRQFPSLRVSFWVRQTHAKPAQWLQRAWFMKIVSIFWIDSWFWISFIRQKWIESLIAQISGRSVHTRDAWVVLVMFDPQSSTVCRCVPQLLGIGTHLKGAKPAAEPGAKTTRTLDGVRKRSSFTVWEHPSLWRCISSVRSEFV